MVFVLDIFPPTQVDVSLVNTPIFVSTQLDESFSELLDNLVTAIEERRFPDAMHVIKLLKRYATVSLNRRQ